MTHPELRLNVEFMQLLLINICSNYVIVTLSLIRMLTGCEQKNMSRKTETRFNDLPEISTGVAVCALKVKL